jgi:hypothetical protein
VSDYSRFRNALRDTLSLPRPSPIPQPANQVGDWARAISQWVDGLTEEALGQLTELMSIDENFDFLTQFATMTIQLKEGLDLRIVEDGIVVTKSGSALGTHRISQSTENRGFAQWLYLVKRMRCRAYITQGTRSVLDPDVGGVQLCSIAEREIQLYVERYLEAEVQNGWYLQYPGYREFINHLAEALSHHEFLHAATSTFGVNPHHA